MRFIKLLGVISYEDNSLIFTNFYVNIYVENIIWYCDGHWWLLYMLVGSTAASPK